MRATLCRLGRLRAHALTAPRGPWFARAQRSAQGIPTASDARRGSLHGGPIGIVPSSSVRAFLVAKPHEARPCLMSKRLFLQVLGEPWRSCGVPPPSSDDGARCLGIPCCVDALSIRSGCQSSGVSGFFRKCNKSCLLRCVYNSSKSSRGLYLGSSSVFADFLRGEGGGRRGRVREHHEQRTGRRPHRMDIDGSDYIIE